jgi:hypothetical protein
MNGAAMLDFAFFRQAVLVAGMSGRHFRIGTRLNHLR